MLHKWYVSQSKASKSALSNKIFKSIKTKKGIGGDIVANVFSKTYFMITDDAIKEAEDNAKLIVKSVNYHDELVKVLSKILTNNNLESFDEAKDLLNRLEKED